MLSIILLALLAQGAPSTSKERLLAATPPDFKTGFSAARGGQTIEERVPKKESVQQWTRMITIQRLGGVAWVGAHGFLDRLVAGFARGCPGSTAGAIEDSTVDGRAVAAVRIDCPLNAETGKPEVMFARVFTGASDLHSVQYAFRSVPGATDAQKARAYLDSVQLCPGTACSENPQ